MNSTSEISRIGREPNAAERGLQLVLEDVDVLERVSQNLFAGANRIIESAALWGSMAEEEKCKWRREALNLLREHVESYRPTVVPDDPDPGASAPAVLNVAVDFYRALRSA